MADKRFIVLEEIGQGGHGKVYRAKDEQLDRVVAIKVFHDSYAEAERLMKEARTLSRLTHDGIVNVYDVSRISIDLGHQTTITLSEDGPQEEQRSWAMIMEDLGDIDPLHYVRENGVRAALQIIVEIAEALQAAHASGIFHCDLNNNNVRVLRGHAKLFDFSLAARTPGRPYGTPAYRAPEQARGEEPSDRTDVYGLGRLLYGLLNPEQIGKAPVEGSRPVLPKLRELGTKGRKQLEDLLQRMLDPDARKRPSVDEVAQVCRAAMRPKFGWRPLILFAGIGALLAALAIVLGSELVRHREDAPMAAKLRVSIGIVHHDKNILMVRRRHKEGTLSWQFPAGIIKPSQDPEQRIIDETLEETGISIKVVGKIGERISPETKVHAVYFNCAYLAGDLRNDDPNENAEVAWVLVEDVEKRITSSIYGGVVELLKGIRDGRVH
ncbi:NUDIX domain-containing protein [Haliangium sp. UPWRP_2]|uniref:protein kinase domain-containing protein n=1 Tax=Haliangium sp. UPWRP_2 TaxID=1931276 RepID=UPI000D0DC74A|nr:NUDIX domain-containing protein [Haliangium sp. UPWRP_2]PSM32314.1 hypothetical protein BVG81_000955 [Haliangium sp. UPWRP_2]